MRSSNDESRSFVITDANQFYDWFVCWQFHAFKEPVPIQYGNDKNKNKNFSLLNKIIPFVSRCSVYSFEDN